MSDLGRGAAPEGAAPRTPRPRGRRKEFVGVVTSDRMQKTRVVTIERMALDPNVGKYIRRRLKVKAHDEREEARAGDRVRIRQTRPLSRDKRWRIVEIVERARRPLETRRRYAAESAPAMEAAVA